MIMGLAEFVKEVFVFNPFLWVKQSAYHLANMSFVLTFCANFAEY